MSESSLLIVGRRVFVPSKEANGAIAYVGYPNFASGKWIGVILDEPKGKNDGSLKGEKYFQCEENYGIFIKPSQLVVFDEDGNPMELPSSAQTPDESPASTTSGLHKPKSRFSSSRISLAGSRQSLAGNRQSLIGSRQSLVGSRQSLVGSRQSLVGSRQSLVGSRQSLAGSHSPLHPSTMTKSTTKVGIVSTQSTQSQILVAVTNSGGSSTVATTPKCASFIETGFMDSLKPQFTPEQSIISPGGTGGAVTDVAAVEEKLTNLQFQQENDHLRSQVRDLNEKLETIRIKRSEDKEKLRDYEKIRLQLDQLLEFKTKILESQVSLQHDLQRAKREARETIEAREQHAKDMTDLAETMEMVTIDKEMAEEKAETLKIELDQARETIEELKIDLEILKTETQNRDGGMIREGEQVATTYEVKQLQQQNSRLRETLVCMRDVAAHEKHEFQKMQKDLDQKRLEIAKLCHSKEKLSARIEEMEQQIADLHEQVDAALGAEEMIEQLSDRKMALEDRVKLLEKELTDLEALQDINEQLNENNAELEQDLREELDLARATTREAIREKEAAYETINDRDQTIQKFRELVQSLQQQLQDMQQRLESETNNHVSALEILDFKEMFTETKAHRKTIDLELRKIETQQAREHVHYFIAYMPDTFMTRGGDHDAVLVLLLFSRVYWKSDILLSQVRSEFPRVEKVDRDRLIRDTQIGQFTFRARLTFLLYMLQAVVDKFLFALNTCKPSTFLNVGAMYPEMADQEKVIDHLIDLLKRDQLDENVPTKGLERCISFLSSLYSVLFADDGELNHNQLLVDNMKALTSALEGINVEACALRTLSPIAPDVGDIGLLAQYIITTGEQIQAQLKLIKRRIPPDTNVINLGFKKDVATVLNACCLHACKVTRTLQETVKGAIQHILSSGDADLATNPDKLKEIAATASEKVYEQDDLGPIQSLKNSLAFILTETTQIAQTQLDNEYDINVGSLTTEKPTPPVVLRAQSVKKELEETKTLTTKLENKEAVIKEIRKSLKQKQDELSEMIVRKELAEKKLDNVHKDYKLTINKLQRKLDEAQNALQRKEKEFEDTMDHLQADIDSLENEKGELKEKLKIYSKKVIIESMKSPTISSSTPDGPTSIVGCSAPTVVTDSPFLLQEIKMLQSALNHEKQLRIKSETALLKDKLNNLKPLLVLQNRPDTILDQLEKELTDAKQNYLMTLATPRVYDFSKRKPGVKPPLDADSPENHILREKQRLNAAKEHVTEVYSKIVAEYVKRKAGGRVGTDFAIFPTNEMSKALKEEKPIKIGEIKIPSTISKYISIVLTSEELHQLHQKFGI